MVAIAGVVLIWVVVHASGLFSSTGKNERIAVQCPILLLRTT